MGSIGGMLGLGGGAAGSGFSGPAGANIQNPATTQQATDQYNNAQAALQQQNQFLQATQAQNGLGNQSNVYNQLQGVVNGTGPNPAQAQLAQATGANVANQAALMAGQRGSNANVGLMARQAAQQGAQTQQQSAGQAATLQAQQSLNALQGAGNMANTQAAQQQAATQQNTAATQGEQGQILGAIGAQNNANVGMQSNVNSANAGLAGQTMGQQGNLLGGVMNGLGSIFAQGGTVPDTSARAMYAQGQYVNSAPMSDDQWNAGGPQNSQSIAPVPAASPQQSAAPVAKQLLNHATTQQPSSPGAWGGDANSAMYKGASSFGKFLAGALSGSSPSDSPNAYGVSGDSPIQTQSDYENDRLQANNPSVNMTGPQSSTSGQSTQDFDPNAVYAAEGGKVPALVSPGEQYIPPKEVEKVAKGQKDPLKAGERIPGKPKFPGNDYRNDTVKKTLESGGMVIPNEVMQAKNPHFEAMKFVHAHIAKNRGKK